MFLEPLGLQSSVTHKRTKLPVVLISSLLFLTAALPGVVLAQEAITTAPASAFALNPYNSADVEKLVRIYFADIPSMIAAAKCESMYRQFNDAGNVLYGGAGGEMIGVFQISKIHVSEAAALGLDIMTLEGNIAYARHLYDQSGMDPWMSSYGCWHSAAKASTATASAIGAAPSAINDLSYGAVSADVLKLQQMLNAAGYTIADSGPGSPGQETTKFGDLTRAAVRRLQCAKLQVCSGNESTTGFGLVDQKTYDTLTTLANSSTPAPQATTAGSDQMASVATASASSTSEDKAAEINAVQSQITTLVSQLSVLNQRLADLTK